MNRGPSPAGGPLPGRKKGGNLSGREAWKTFALNGGRGCIGGDAREPVRP